MNNKIIITFTLLISIFASSCFEKEIITPALNPNVGTNSINLIGKWNAGSLVILGEKTTEGTVAANAIQWEFNSDGNIYINSVPSFTYKVVNDNKITLMRNNITETMDVIKTANNSITLTETVGLKNGDSKSTSITLVHN